ncbi:E2F transcription factor-like E2FE [Zea mays]|uniref:E2F transcription factor-like E2FE n=1 Tax=Zea mays TaxID=4577 RepID=A0A1D6JF03_MAIZE|nr:E2F transcription factor-like E2FE [Zea mays]
MDVDSRMATESDSDSDARGGSGFGSETPTASSSPSVVSLAPTASSSPSPSTHPTPRRTTARSRPSSRRWRAPRPGDRPLARGEALPCPSLNHVLPPPPSTLPPHIPRTPRDEFVHARMLKNDGFSHVIAEDRTDQVYLSKQIFMVLYNRDNVESIGLDEAAKCLGVERRRIYDIVNVLEGVGIQQEDIVAFYWSFFYQTQCHSFCRWSRNPNGVPLESLGYKQGYRVDVDIPDQTWVEACSFHDVLIFNTGHCWDSTS